VRKHPPPHQNGPPLRLVEYRYLIISTRSGWHMIKFKIHALCKKSKIFWGGGPLPIPIPQREGDTRGASNTLAPALPNPTQIVY